MPNDSSPYDLSLGGVTFYKFEVPGDLSLQLTEKVAVFDFPGGERTAQLFGAFPPESVSWTGHMFVDEVPQANVFDRSFQIAQLRGQQLTLTYGPISYQCILHEFTMGIKQQFWIPYTITIIPLQDNSQAGASSVQQVSPTTQVAQNNQQVSQATVAPASGVALPQAIQQSVATFQTNLAQAMQSAANNVGNIPATTNLSLQNQIQAIQNQLLPLLNPEGDIA